MGFDYDPAKKTALVPAYRTDVIHMIDLAEDIGIAYGYNNVPEVIPNVATIGEEDKLNAFCEKMREILVGHGFLEVKNYCLASKDEQNKSCNLNNELVELKNSQAEGRNVMRNWLLPSLLRTLSENKHREYPQNLFEIGEVFHSSAKTDTGVDECMSLSVVMSSEEIDYTRIRQLLDNIIKSLSLEADTVETEHPSSIKGRVGKILCNKREIACIGELAPDVLSNFSLITPAAAFEINLSELFALLNPN
jgi:phenylalanyl-tRNA synthetase beta chain